MNFLSYVQPEWFLTNNFVDFQSHVRKTFEFS